MTVTTIIPGNQCPGCKAEVDAQSGTQDRNAVPKPGDWTLCALCSSVNIFNDDLTQRVATRTEIDALDPHFKNHLCKALQAIEEVRRKLKV